MSKKTLKVVLDSHLKKIGNKYLKDRALIEFTNNIENVMDMIPDVELSDKPTFYLYREEYCPDNTWSEVIGKSKSLHEIWNLIEERHNSMNEDAKKYNLFYPSFEEIYSQPNKFLQREIEDDWVKYQIYDISGKDLKNLVNGKIKHINLMKEFESYPFYYLIRTEKIDANEGIY